MAVSGFFDRFKRDPIGRPAAQVIDVTESRWLGDPALPFSTTTNIVVQGCQIPATGLSYKPIVFQHLREIGAFAAGQVLYQALSATAPARRQKIVYAGPLANSAAGTTAGYKLLRKRHDGSEWVQFAAELTATMLASGQTPAQLGQALYNVQIPRWTGAMDPSVFRAIPIPVAPAPPGGGMPPAPPIPPVLIGQKLTAWAAGNFAGGTPTNDEMDALCLVLEPHLANGAGVSSRIQYDPHKVTPGRPALVGLYHELVHGLYNAQGAQLGREDSINENNGGRLFEAMAVGLGPFGPPRTISENAFRASINVPARTTYP